MLSLPYTINAFKGRKPFLLRYSVSPVRLAVGILTAWDIFMKRIDLFYDSSNKGRGKVTPGAVPRVQGHADNGSGFKTPPLLCNRA